jgi:hypothetical protein
MVDSDDEEELVEGGIKGKRNIVPLQNDNDDSYANMELPDQVVESTDLGAGGN